MSNRRLHGARCLTGLVALLPFVGCRTAGPGLEVEGVRPASVEQAQVGFERLKTLVGDWVGSMGGGRGPAEVSFFITGKGSALVERMIIEDPVEMVSVYHLEHGRLVMAHFCAAGNQPRMVLVPSGQGASLSFALAEASGFDAKRDLHMHAREIVALTSDRLAMVWETYRNGRLESRDTLLLQRRAAR